LGTLTKQSARWIWYISVQNQLCIIPLCWILWLLKIVIHIILDSFYEPIIWLHNSRNRIGFNHQRKFDIYCINKNRIYDCLWVWKIWRHHFAVSEKLQFAYINCINNPCFFTLRAIDQHKSISQYNEHIWDYFSLHLEGHQCTHYIKKWDNSKCTFFTKWEYSICSNRCGLWVLY